MSATWIVWVPLLVLPVLLLLVFAGCVGEDPDIAREEGRRQGETEAKTEADRQKAEEDKKKADADAAQKAAAQYHNVVLKEVDLVSYWRLNETQPGNWACLDSAPDMPQHGEYKSVAGVSRGESGALALLKDPNDKATTFDGVQGYVEMPHHGLLNPPLDFSLETWVRLDPGANGSPAPLVVAGAYEADPASGQPQRGYVLEVIPPAGPGGMPVIQGRLGGAGGVTTIQANLDQAGLLSGWHHVVLTYSGGPKAVRLYVNAADGKPDSELTATTSFAANQAAPFRIAAGHAEAPNASPAPARFFRGRIDEVALYRVALPGSTVSQHFLAATTQS